MKSNLQKMLDGEAYDSRDPELLKLYHRARALILEYSTCDSRDLEGRKNLLNQLLGKVGNGV
jgi:maltose O-acetyltransferase